jgi:hypothetical protein
MDGRRFDGIARAAAMGGAPRRRLLALLVGGVIASGMSRRAVAQEAGAAAASEDACAAGLTDCPGAGCVDLRADLLNCGACGAVCESGLVSVRCNAGVCERASCVVGQEYCGAVDGCRDLQSDPAHCGGCGRSCGDGVCQNGACADPDPGGACAEGQANCAGVCIDLCCNNAHCGACGNACTGGLTCFEGICDCPSGLCEESVQGGSGNGNNVGALPATGAGPATGGTARVAAILTGAAAAAGWLGRRRADSSAQ